MQTDFKPELLADPAMRESEGILRSCVHCGFCTATCPTYVLLGDELDSPRGRIYLIKDMLEGGKPASAEVVTHLDRCLSCLSCMTTCPSGVHYGHLIDHARAHVERTFRRPLPDRLLRAMLGRVLPDRRLFRWAMLGARLARPFARLLPATGPTGRRLGAMLGLAPARLPAPEPDAATGVHPAVGERRGRVALLAGCAQSVLAPGINAAAVRLLTRMGVEVVVRAEARCCGALNHHMGDEAPARAHARATIAAWTAEIDAGLDAILVTTSGCGTVVKDYGHMFRDDPVWAARAAAVSAKALDVSQYLARLDYRPSRPAPDLTVAYHAACSLQHGQGVTGEPKALLRRAGFRVVEPRDPHLCCGSAGTYNILQPEIAGRLRARKLETLEARAPDLVAAGNIGCITQLQGGRLPLVHTVELLDWMAGGPVPGAVASIEGARPAA